MLLSFCANPHSLWSIFQDKWVKQESSFVFFVFPDGNSLTPASFIRWTTLVIIYILLCLILDLLGLGSPLGQWRDILLLVGWAIPMWGVRSHLKLEFWISPVSRWVSPLTIFLFKILFQGTLRICSFTWNLKLLYWILSHSCPNQKFYWDLNN